jgi:hypothetical protein
MTKSVKKLLIGAALTGFVVGTTVAASASPKPLDDSKTPTTVEKHCCAKMNTCAGKGGCGADKGKNSCKGQGGCNTSSGKADCHSKPGHCTDSK